MTDSGERLLKVHLHPADERDKGGGKLLCPGGANTERLPEGMDPVLWPLLRGASAERWELILMRRSGCRKVPPFSVFPSGANLSYRWWVSRKATFRGSGPCP